MRLIKLTALLILCFLTFAFANSSLDELKTKAESGDVEAQYELGSKYREKIDLTSRREAGKWLRLAAMQGHARAQLELGHLYDPQDMGTRALLDQRYARIIDSIKPLYGVSKPHKFADDSVEYFIYDILRKDKNSENLAYDSARNAIYDSLRNEYDAERWYLMAAEQGLAEAQCALGMHYSFGWGKKGLNIKEAFFWLEKAAMQNNSDAQIMLWQHYVAPLPDVGDLVRAYFWLKISIKNKTEFVERYRVELADVEKRMSDEQLQEAQLLLKKEKDQILNQNQK